MRSACTGTTGGEAMTNTKLELIEKRIRESIAIKEAIAADGNLLKQVESLAEDCLVALRNGGKIIFAGNGGSFADAQHLSAEFVSRFMFDRNPLPALALGTNSSCFSALANDYGYDQVFSRELLAIVTRNDLLIAISTSGNSPNIIKLIKAAQDSNIKIYALTGETGGQIAGQCQCLKIPSNLTARIQEAHILIGHIVCEIVEFSLFKE